MDKKELFLKEEGNAWFQRNRDTIRQQGEVSLIYKSLSKFLKRQGIVGKQYSILEVGCSYGYNLAYLNDNIKTSCYGIDPSLDAINYGKSQFSKTQCSITLTQGTSDLLPYDNEKFDVVIIGFCLLWVDRKYLFQSVTEADRVLKTGGYLIIIDFDTPIPYKRDYIHNAQVFTYKMQYSNLFLANPQYYFIDKKNFTHNGIKFDKDVQERIALNILYKDTEENTYQRL